MQTDVPQSIGAITREVSARDQDGAPARVVSTSRTYHTTPADLWDALAVA